MNTSLRFCAFASCALLVSSTLGCGTPDGEGDSGTPGSSTGPGPSTIDPVESGGDFNIGEDAGIGQSSDPRVDNGLEVREQICDDAGNCTCLSLALLGTLETKATDKDTSAFQDWLNENSGGTATVTMVDSYQPLDETFLSQYDILIVANINSWTFTEADKMAVSAWSDQGGGIVNLTGFESTATEASKSSQLIEFAGLSYTGTQLSETTAQNGQDVPVYWNDGETDLKRCLFWNGSGDSNPQITTPISFSPLAGTLEDLTFELDYVGAFIGWPVSAPADATVVATDPVSGGIMAVAHEPKGLGRVFAFGDEWVIFANQWEPAAGGTPTDNHEVDHNDCYIKTDVEPDNRPVEEKFHSVKTVYQTKQFWYNAITWVAPPNECNFEITDTDVVIR